MMTLDKYRYMLRRLAAICIAIFFSTLAARIILLPFWLVIALIATTNAIFNLSILGISILLAVAGAFYSFKWLYSYMMKITKKYENS